MSSFPRSNWSAAEIAAAEKVYAQFREPPAATLLAPDTQEAILEARQSKGLQLKELTRAMPSEWEEQRKWLRAPGHNELTGYWDG